MKKIFSSLLCVGILSTFANAANMISVDTSFASIKNEDDDIDIKKDTITFWSIKAQKYVTDDNEGAFAGVLRIGGGYFYSDIVDLITDEKHKAGIKYVDGDALLGYGFYTQENIHKTSISLLGGFHGKSYVFDDETETNKPNLDKLNLVGIKFGVSALTILQNEIVLNADVFARKYINAKSKVHKKHRRVKIDANAMLGYKFGQNKDGLIIGFKYGYRDDIINKGEHFGISVGYIF